MTQYAIYSTANWIIMKTYQSNYTRKQEDGRTSPENRAILYESYH